MATTGEQGHIPEIQLTNLDVLPSAVSASPVTFTFGDLDQSATVPASSVAIETIELTVETIRPSSFGGDASPVATPMTDPALFFGTDSLG